MFEMKKLVAKIGQFLTESSTHLTKRQAMRRS